METEEYEKTRQTLTGKVFVCQKETDELMRILQREEDGRHRALYELDSLKKLMSSTNDEALIAEMNRRVQELEMTLKKNSVELEKRKADLAKYMAEMKDAQRQLAMIEKSMALEAEIQKNLSQIDSYQSVDRVNQDEFSELVQAAMGDRSMRQFASDLGYNVSSISRIINKKLRGTCSDEMLAAIASHAAEESGVTVDKLMSALGKKRVIPGAEFEERGKRIIRNDLLDRGYSISEENSQRLEGPGFGFRFDYSIKTDALNCKEGRWVFDFKSVTSGFVGNEHVIPVGFGRIRQSLTMIMSLFYCGALKADKVSICVDHRATFEDMIKKLEGLKVRDNISIILITGGRVADEHILPLQNGTTPESIFKNSTPVKKDVKDTDDIDWDDRMFDEEDC